MNISLIAKLYAVYTNKNANSITANESFVFKIQQLLKNKWLKRDDFAIIPSWISYLELLVGDRISFHINLVKLTQIIMPFIGKND